MGHNGLLFFFCNCFAYQCCKIKITCTKFPGFPGWKNQERIGRNCGNFQPGFYLENMGTSERYEDWMQLKTELFI
jgi:hypothetical protein